MSAKGALEMRKKCLICGKKASYEFLDKAYCEQCWGFVKKSIRKYRGFTIFGQHSSYRPNYLIVETGERFWQLKQAKKRIDEILGKGRTILK